MPTVEMLSAEELRARRATILSRTGLTEEELRERAEQFLLTPELTASLVALDEIDYLLGE